MNKLAVSGAEEQELSDRRNGPKGLYEEENKGLYEVILARLRFGHPHATHWYLMENDHHKFCDDCIVPLSVKHILAECPSFRAGRIRYYGQLPSQLGDILAEQLMNIFDPNKLVNVQDINFFEQDLMITE